MTNHIKFTLSVTNHEGSYQIACTCEGEEDVSIPQKDAIANLTGKSLLIKTWITSRGNQYESDLRQVGTALYDIFLKPSNHFLQALERAKSLNLIILLNIQTEDLQVSCLPWELLFLPGEGYIGKTTRFQLIRTMAYSLPRHTELSPGPLRILFMACSPDGTKPLLNYEKEEENILAAVMDLKKQQGLEIDFAETGTVEELREMLEKKQYHLIHLSCHGFYNESDNTGYLCMEHETGALRQVSAYEFADLLIGHTSVQALFLSACETGREEVQRTGLAKLLISRGIPMVVAMNYSISDNAAIELARSMYRHVCLQQPLFKAFQTTKEEYSKKFSGNFQWAIPAVFARGDDSRLVDWGKPFIPLKTEAATAVYVGKIKHLKTGFRGRRREQREFLRQLREGNPPSLTIIGPGGVGKSTLASRLAGKFHHRGYLIVPMYSEITLDALIRETIFTLQSARKKEEADYLKQLSDNEERFSYLLRALMGDLNLVFLFDNFEDNLSKATGFKTYKNEFWASSFQLLVDHLPNTESKMLVTCRYKLPGIPESLMVHQTLNEFTKSEAIKFILSLKDYDAITYIAAHEIYHSIGGNPKAIENTGKLLASTPVTWDKLQENLQHVKKEMREFQVFEILYGFLTPDQQRFFRKISLYRRAVDIDGLNIHEPFEDRHSAFIQALTDYGLLQVFTESGEAYYLVHPLNRGFIRDEWWEENEKIAAHKDCSLCYTHSEISALDELMEAAWHLKEACEFNEMADLILSHSEQLRRNGDWDESLYLNFAIYENPNKISPLKFASACNNIGLIYGNKGDWDKALEYHHQSENIKLEFGDNAVLASTYNNIGSIYYSKGEWQKALEYFLKSEKILIEVGDKARLAPTYNNIGIIYRNRGEWDKALEYYLESEKIRIANSDKVGLAQTYNNIGLIYSKKGEWEKALDYYFQAEMINIEVRNTPGLATTYNNIGLIYSKKGEWDKALEYYLKSYKISIGFGDKAGLATIYNNIGIVYRNKGDRDKALEYYLKSEMICIEVGDKAGLTAMYNNIGEIYSKKGELDNALKYYLQSEMIRIEIGDITGLATTYFNLGSVLQHKGDPEKGDPFIILAGFIAKTHGMKYDLEEMAWALEPLLMRLSEKEFMEIGQRLYEERVSAVSKL